MATHDASSQDNTTSSQDAATSSQDARAKVFELPELLALILGHLPGASLFFAGKVNKAWRAEAHQAVSKRRRQLRTRLITAQCAREGSLNLLKHARTAGYPWGPSVCVAAALEGHLETLQWLRVSDPPCPWDAWVCAAAARGGHLEVLQWLRAQDPPCPWRSLTCFEAARRAHHKILQWAHENGCEWDGCEGCEHATPEGHRVKIRRERMPRREVPAPAATLEGWRTTARRRRRPRR